MKTAFVLTYYKAVVCDVLGSEFSDKVSMEFVIEPAKQGAEYMAKIFPPIVPWLKLRDKYFDEVIEKYYAEGYTQVVILGVGFDNRSLRFKDKEINFFEIDYADILGFKKQKYEELKLNSKVNFIPGDYLKINLKKELIKSGLNPDDNILFIWEGNSYYMQEESTNLLILLYEVKKQFYLILLYEVKKVLHYTKKN
ncbi:MAG: class I SAM-dependent methyltransferase, partial [Bacteroidales bacterium]|nr:class I SAM-dependent methyltransferase [Bacteroidales bacterium]